MAVKINKIKIHLVKHSSKSNKSTDFRASKRSFTLLIPGWKGFSITDPTLDEDYQYFKKSIIPTFHFQDSLPRLPIPELEKTCQRYLKAQRPLLSDESYVKTKSFVDKFMKEDGVECQNTLVTEDKANKHTSYISKPWFDFYLADRTPLPINYNPVLVFVNHPVPQLNSQTVKAANLIISSLRFYKSLQEETLEPEVYNFKPNNDTGFLKKFIKILPRSVAWYGAYVFNAFPLDMSQYKHLFNTSRIPAYRAKDTIKHLDGKRHLLVMRGGNFYTVDVLDENGDIVGPELILGAIQEILNSGEMDALHSVGVLTTEDRDVWATARTHLENIGNSEVLDLVDTALFNLVLDDGSPGFDPVIATRFFLHGDGTNRWFDKSFSLIVAKDGTAGLNFEHSWGDGVAVLRYFNDIHIDYLNKPRVQPDTPSKENPSVRKLEFKLDGKAICMINEAQKTYKKTCDSLEVRVLDYNKCGWRMCSFNRMGPDALMQLAFQIAHHQVTGSLGSIYESCQTCAFKHGRTEGVRPCTIETKKVCQALNQLNPPGKKELREMVYECSKVHSTLVKEAAMGQGFDRHLFALKLKAEELGLKPEVFDDPAYSAINHNVLSASAITSDNLQLGAFGPAVQDGYGIAYSLWADRLGSVVTNYKNRADGAGFINALEKTLDRLNNILKP